MCALDFHYSTIPSLLQFVDRMTHSHVLHDSITHKQEGRALGMRALDFHYSTIPSALPSSWTA